MEVKVYSVDGKLYNVRADREKEFLGKYPNAVLAGIPGAEEPEIEEPETDAASEPVATVKGYTSEGKPKSSTASTTAEPKPQVRTEGTGSSSGDGSSDYIGEALSNAEAYRADEYQTAEASKAAGEELNRLNRTAHSSATDREVADKEAGEASWLDSTWRELNPTGKSGAARKRVEEAQVARTEAKNRWGELRDNAHFDILSEYKSRAYITV